MTEEEVRQLKQAYADLKEEAVRKDQQIEKLEALLMRALLRREELERRLGKDSHTRSKPPSSDGLSRKGNWLRSKGEKHQEDKSGIRGILSNTSRRLIE